MTPHSPTYGRKSPFVTKHCYIFFDTCKQKQCQVVLKDFCLNTSCHAAQQLFPKVVWFLLSATSVQSNRPHRRCTAAHVQQSEFTLHVFVTPVGSECICH